MQAYKSADCAFGTLTPYLALMYAISDYSFPNRVLLCLRKSGPGKFLVNKSAGLSHPENQTVLTIPASFNSRRKFNLTCRVRPPQLQLLARSTTP